MRRSLNSGVAALLVAGLAGLSAPGLALAHGYAHHEASEHAGEQLDHHHRKANGAIDVAHEELRASVHAADDSNDHVHPQLSQGPSVRLDAPLFVLHIARESLSSGIVFVGTASLLATAAPARAGPPDALSRQPRAPPRA